MNAYVPHESLEFSGLDFDSAKIVQTSWVQCYDHLRSVYGSRPQTIELSKLMFDLL